MSDLYTHSVSRPNFSLELRFFHDSLKDDIILLSMMQSSQWCSLLNHFLNPNKLFNDNCFISFLDPEGGSQKPSLVVVVFDVVIVVVISSLKIPKALLIRSGAQ